MDFELNDEQRMLKDSLRNTLDRDYSFERRNARVAAGPSAEQWRTFADMGWLGAALPEEAGGFGGGPIESALVAEEFGRRLVIEPYVAIAVLAGRTLVACADAAMVPLAKRLAEGAARPVLAHSEYAAGSRVDWIDTRVAEAPAGGWRLNGRKSAVWGAPFADSYLVSARSAGEPGGRSGVSLFHVPADAKGLTLTPVRLVDGSWAGELELADVILPAEARFGAPGGAMEVLEDAYAHGITALCADAVGAMEAALWITRDYLQTRHQFGQPIGSFQALQHRMADMVIELELSRSITYRAIAYLGSDARQRQHAVSAAKVQIGKSAKFVGGAAIQLHGAIGVTEEYIIGHYFKRLTLIDFAFGSPATHLGIMSELRAAVSAAREPAGVVRNLG